MISGILERRPGRSLEFFRLIRFILVLVIGPALVRLHPYFEARLVQQTLIAAFAIYVEATLEAFIDFVDAVRFYYLWKTKNEPRKYTRGLRGINLPKFMVPTKEDNSTGAQVIRGRHYFFIAFLAGLAAGVACIPAIVIDAIGLRTVVSQRIVGISLLLSVTIGTGGNFLAGVLFLIERFGHEGVIGVGGDHMRIILSLLYSLWILFASIALFCRIWVHTSSEAKLRVLANVFLFKVSTDAIVAATEGHSGQIDLGRIYLSITEQDGTARVTAGTEPTTQKVSLEKVERIS